MAKTILNVKNTQEVTVILSGASDNGNPVVPREIQGTAGAYALTATLTGMAHQITRDAYLFTPIFVMYDGKELQVTSFEVTADIDDDGEATNLKVVLS